ncbi:O-sialoglycoprotein endopeptidase [Legionella waltersii]|uniref:tRNA threonylcarbamoyladenosine biosynthesis protein TsaB n=2 Tax=Legionella waltersii TaxID=66969 RepID=A0A0W1AMC3_9GAMM|nr:O-sialoglycoprotein endopeptidase [Legionella waltersii]SNV02860.1 glycoprotease (O-sialoglycoprotein endopeptidase) [Legionella waltersii]
MKSLAIDTSTEKASVALKIGNELISEEQDNQRTHAQFILPMIERLLARAEMPKSQLDRIIFGCGPGSFTGLRIACSIAKGLAYSNDIGLIPVSTLASIAWSVREIKQDDKLGVLSIIDARMQEVYWSYFPTGSYGASEAVNHVSCIQTVDEKQFVIAGVGIDLYWNEFSDHLRNKVIEKLTVFPQATSMISLAEHLSLEEISVDKAQPTYIRNQVTQGASGG